MNTTLRIICILKNSPDVTLVSRLLAAVLLFCGALMCGVAWAQEKTKSTPKAPAITKKLVQNKLKEIEDSEKLSKDLKEKIAKIYKNTLQDLENIKTETAKINHFEVMIKTADSKLKEIEKKLSQPLPKIAASIPDQASLAKLEEILKAARKDLNEVKSEVQKLEAEPIRRQVRLKEISKEKIEADKTLEDIKTQLQTPAPAGEDPALTEARQIRLHTRKQLTKKRLTEYQKELAAYDATKSLLPKERDEAVRRQEYLEKKIQKLETLVNQRKQQQANEEEQKARQEVLRSQPALRPLARRNQELTEKNSGLLDELKSLSDTTQSKEQELADLEKKSKSAKERVEQIGLTEAMGLLLRKQRAQLPSVEKLRAGIADREEKIRAAQMALFDLEESRNSLADMDGAVQQTLQNIRKLPENITRANLKDEAEKLLEKQKKYLDTLLQTYNDYFEKLVHLNNLDTQLIQRTTTYANYIDERILWVRSTGIVSLDDFRHAGTALGWMIRPHNWQEILKALGDDALRHPVLIVLAVLLLGGWIAVLRPLRKRLKALGEMTAKGSCQQIRPTFLAILLTVAKGSVLPVLLFFLAWRLHGSGSPSVFVYAVGHSLHRTAEILLFLMLFLEVCRSKGLAEAHFGWRKQVCALLRTQLTWFIIIGLPCVFIGLTLNFQENEVWKNSLGRLSFIVWVLLIAIFFHIIFRPGGPTLQRAAMASSTSLGYRLRYLWYALGVLVPLVLGVLAVFGYLYTAYQLMFCLRETVSYLVGILLLGALLLRWLLMHHRRLAFLQLQQRRERKPEPVPGGEAGVAAILSEAAAEKEIDLNSISEQSRKLLRFGLMAAAIAGIWVIWSGVLPALRIMNQVTLWQTTDGDHVHVIHLGHLMLALLVAAAALLAVRNVPGLLELLLLQRLPLDAGARYAFTTLLRYLIVIIATIIAFQLLGISWSQYQWLVAAATVGLGFGLQEIFANFVSGIILLLERPIRIGDVVTVSDVTGTVTRIAMRYTIITNWDRKEYVVPNKDFVTGRVLNWTLSNRTNRITLHVGVAYASEPEQVRGILLQIAHDNPLVLSEPEPLVTFEEFGDSSLNFVLRCYLPNLENLLTVTHQINSAILHEFRKANIEIPFPQRDLNIRTTPVAVSLPAEDGKAANETNRS